MPLIKGKSDRAFSENVRTEMHEGKPLGQSLAIAYATKRRAKKARGGEVGVNQPSKKMSAGDHQGTSRAGEEVRKAHFMKEGVHASDAREVAKDLQHDTLQKLKGMRRNRENLQRGGYAGRRYAEGGEVDNYQSPSTSRDQEDHRINFHEDETHEYECPPEPGVEHNSAAVMEDDRDLNQHGEDEQGPYSMLMSEGGFIGSHQTDEHELDMVDRIMAQRQEHFSRGGQVANHTPAITGSEENEFDDLVLRDDDMEDADYTGANSGDEKGNASYDERSDDMVSRIMRSRRLKSKGMPEVMARQQ